MDKLLLDSENSFQQLAFDKIELVAQVWNW